MNLIPLTILLTITLALLLTLGGRPYKAFADKTGKDAQVEQALRQLETETVEALVKNDTASLKRIWADEYSFTAPNGQVVSKENYLSLLQTGTVKYDKLTVEDLKIRVYGDAAVATARVSVKGRVGAHELDGDDRFLTVYVKRQGQWVQVATQAARIQQ